MNVERFIPENIKGFTSRAVLAAMLVAASSVGGRLVPTAGAEEDIAKDTCPAPTNLRFYIPWEYTIKNGRIYQMVRILWDLHPNAKGSNVALAKTHDTTLTAQPILLAQTLPRNSTDIMVERDDVPAKITWEVFVTALCSNPQTYESPMATTSLNVVPAVNIYNPR